MSERMVTVDLRRSIGLRRDRLYGPGKGIAVPESLARALGIRGTPAPGAEGGQDEVELPPIAKLADALAGLDDDAVRRMQSADDRKSAVAIYRKRLEGA